MKKSIILLSLSLIAACGNPEKNNEQAENPAAGKSITIKGSDTVLPLTQQEAEKFMNSHKETAITVVGGGSGVGITALIEGTTDIAMSSRPLKMDEKATLEEKGITYKEINIAGDALAVIVHANNSIEKLTKEQVADIFTGKIKNWKEVGGKDLPVIAYSRETSSGTYEFFKEHVMDKKNYASSVLNMPATGAIVQSVSQTEGAIGYIGLAYETKEVKHLSISYDKGTTYVAPSIENAQNGSYPVSRPLFYYYDVKTEASVDPFIKFILSDEGQQIVKETGYVPLVKTNP